MGDPSQLKQAIADSFSGVETTICLSTKVIVITEDQLELRLEDGIRKLSGKDAWIPPASILISCLLTLFTADFKSYSWVASGTLRGIFISLSILSGVWLLWSCGRIKKFGRSEFMASIRNAGSPYNLSQGVAGSGPPQLPRSLTHEQVAATNGDVTATLQCRQCGNVLPSTVPGRMARCARCGTVN